MNIAHLLGTSTSSALEAVYGQRKKRDDDDTLQNAVHSWRQDRVSISDAALALVEQAGKEQAPSEGDSSQDSLNGQNRNASLPEAKTGGAEETEGSVEAAGGGQQGFSSGGNSSVSDIESKIKALQQKIVETQNSDLPEDAKSAMISGLQSQISQLAQEKNALESQPGKA